VKLRLSKWILLGLLVVSGLVMGGCATSEPDNMSARPWNAPRSWETGLPSGLFEGR
jgi:hypothetical protein